MEQKPPDVLLVGPEWPERALLRAQFIEEGFDVVAVDTWPIPRRYRRRGMKPRVLLIDLRDLPSPRETMHEVRFLLPPPRVLVVTALGILSADEVKGFGFNIVERPTSIGEIVAITRALLLRTSTDQSDHVASPRRTP
jgi:DNA-binding response OmpR family regulator